METSSEHGVDDKSTNTRTADVRRWNSSFEKIDAPPEHIMEKLRLPGELDKNQYAYVIGKLYRTPDSDPNDEAIITEEMKHIDPYDITCKPVYLEHQYEETIGNIFRHHFDETTRSLWVGLLLHNGPGVRGDVVKQVRDGKLNSLSIGLVRPVITKHSEKKSNSRTYKTILEASIVKDPKIKGCHIVEVHSKTPASSETQTRQSSAMDTGAQTTTTAATTSATTATANKTPDTAVGNAESSDTEDFTAGGVIKLLKTMLDKKKATTSSEEEPEQTTRQQQQQQSGQKRKQSSASATQKLAATTDLDSARTKADAAQVPQHMNQELIRRYQEVINGKPITDTNELTNIAMYLNDLPESTRAANLVQILSNFSDVSKIAEESKKRMEAETERYRASKTEKLKGMLDYMVSEAKTLDIKDMGTIETITNFFVDPKNAKAVETFERMYEDFQGHKTKNDEMSKRVKDLEERESKIMSLLNTLEEGGAISTRAAKKAKMNLGFGGEMPKQQEILAHGSGVVKRYLGDWVQKHSEKGVGEKQSAQQVKKPEEVENNQFLSAPTNTLGSFERLAELKQNSIFATLPESTRKPIYEFNPVSHMWPDHRLLQKQGDLIKGLKMNEEI